MAKAFSKMMSASEGRYLTAIENERSLRASLELPHRMLVSQLIQHSEFEIVDFATHAFCDIAPGFEAPNGSLRRKKGHQDGRIILRYAAQAIREGSTEIVFEKVLSWLVGHLDGGNVTGEHMEVFFHFIQQGARRELPAHAHPFIDNVFEEIIGCVRRASYSATIHKAHRRIAEFAVDRVMSILPDVKAKYGASSVPKCKRDMELLVKEVARLMKSESPHSMKKQFSGWLIDRLMNQVEYSSDVWYWMFLATALDQDVRVLMLGNFLLATMIPLQKHWVFGDSLTSPSASFALPMMAVRKLCALRENQTDDRDPNGSTPLPAEPGRNRSHRGGGSIEVGIVLAAAGSDRFSPA